MLEGNFDTPILFVVSGKPVLELGIELTMYSHYRELLLSTFRRQGITSDEISFCLEQDRAIICAHRANIVVPLGDSALCELTGLVGIDKWQCSVLSAKQDYSWRKVLPLLHPERVYKIYADSFYLSLGAHKLKTEMKFPQVKVPNRKILIDATLPEIEAYLEECKSSDTIGFDIETGCGQINTLGFAKTKTDAIAIRVDSKYWSQDELYRIWQCAHSLLEHPVPKVCQNYIYEQIYLSAYGIEVKNVVWDTMWAMKFLFPELEKGLHNVGRVFTPYPYWKDDNDDWNNIRDWAGHLTYNCADTTGTLWAYYEQLIDMKERNLLEPFQKLVLSNMPIITEMCTNGLYLDTKIHQDECFKAQHFIQDRQEFVDRYFHTHLQRTVNTRSPKQMKAAFREMGFTIPFQKGKESLDKKALTKMRKKHPKNDLIPALMDLSRENKKESSYLGFDFDRATGRVPYQLDGAATETGRWGSYTDPWGKGFNAQTVPKNKRRMYMAKPGQVLVQIDLSQAESRYVAYDGPEPTLMELLESGKDVHRFVASRIFNKPEDLIGKNSKERQLGKKAGHAANYGTGPRTFAEMCLVDMDIVMEEREAKRILHSYFEVFPGIGARQRRIQQEIRQHKRITTPLGRERVFYDRIGDDLFRQAYAQAPQSTIPDITNFLMRYLYENFEEAQFLLQVHDSILLSVEDGRQFEIAEAARDYKAWHPEILLAGGKLIIPVDCEYGSHWEPMVKL